MANKIENIIASTFMEMAEGLETGYFGKRPKIALVGLGSELGEENALEGVKLAVRAGVDVVYIGTLEAEGVTTIKVETEEGGHQKMGELLKEKKVDGAVAMHFPFPIGVSTVGRVVTPARGKEMFIATTTGTSSVDRIEGMIKNAVYGVIAAKACGVKRPTVGILNVDGARQTEIALKELKEQGYELDFAQSGRVDGGCILRGNDVLQGSADVLVCDSLSGNVLMKMLSSYTTGGNYEASGYGYGPGIGEGYEQLVMIISRASGAPVVSGALQYASELVNGKVLEVAREEFFMAKQAGLEEILGKRRRADKKVGKRKSAGEEAAEKETTEKETTEKEIAGEEIAEKETAEKETTEKEIAEKETTEKEIVREVIVREEMTEEVVAPPKEVVTAEISGIEIMDLEDGVQVLWKSGIYAESGMGCTGAIILVSEKNLSKAEGELKKEGFI